MLTVALSNALVQAHLHLALQPLAPRTSIRHELGRMHVVCQSCRAKHWIEEKVDSSSAELPTFSMCCGKGKVKVPQLEAPPRELDELLRGQDPGEFASCIVLAPNAFADCVPPSLFPRSQNPASSETRCATTITLSHSARSVGRSLRSPTLRDLPRSSFPALSTTCSAPSSLTTMQPFLLSLSTTSSTLRQRRKPRIESPRGRRDDRRRAREDSI